MAVEELWRYPVKSMGGEQLDVADVGELGIDGDRQWAVIDLATGYGLTAKREPELLFASASVVDGEVLDPPRCGRHADRHRGGHRRRAQRLARQGGVAAPRHARSAGTFEIAADFEAEHDSDLLHWQGPEGTFHDSTRRRVSIAARHEMRDWSPRRFRMNMLTSGDSSAGLVGSEVHDRLDGARGRQAGRSVHPHRRVPSQAASSATSTCCGRSIEELGGDLGVGAMVVAAGRIRAGRLAGSAPDEPRRPRGGDDRSVALDRAGIGDVDEADDDVIDAGIRCTGRRGRRAVRPCRRGRCGHDVPSTSRGGRVRSTSAPTWSRSSPTSTVPRWLTETVGRIATDGDAVLAQHRDLVGDDRRLAEQVAGVGMLGDEPQRAPLTGAADEDRHVRLQRTRVARRVRDVRAPRPSNGLPPGPHICGSSGQRVGQERVALGARSGNGQP